MTARNIGPAPREPMPVTKPALEKHVLLGHEYTVENPFTMTLVDLQEAHQRARVRDLRAGVLDHLHEGEE